MTIIDELSVETFAKGFSGQILRPGEAEYDKARTLFNGMIDRRPALTVQPRSPKDVAAAIKFALDSGLEISIRGGGHGVTGAAVTDGGLMIDLRSMNSVEVDADARIARVGGGANWGEYDAATQAFGLGSTGGRASTTGVAGLTLGGGSGWIERKYGLACDALRSVEIVTAAGETVIAGNDENPELFWALRGGGGNFGVATAFEFNLRPLGPEIFASLIFYSKEDAGAVARNYRAFIEAECPREVGGGFGFLTAPPEEFIPESVQGTVVCAVVVTWCGEIEKAEGALAPLLAFGNPVAKIAMPLPYAQFQSMLDDPPGYRNYWSAEYLSALPDEALDIWERYGNMQRPSPAQLLFLPWGGAVAEGPDSAFSAREANWVFHPLCLWSEEADDDFWFSFGRDSKREVSKFGIGRSYANFDFDMTGDKVPAGFGPERYARLQKVKAAFDPQNVFHLNANIKP